MRGNGKETGKKKGHRGFPMGIGTGGKTLMIFRKVRQVKKGKEQDVQKHRNKKA